MDSALLHPCSLGQSGTQSALWDPLLGMTEFLDCRPWGGLEHPPGTDPMSQLHKGAPGHPRCLGQTWPQMQCHHGTGHPSSDRSHCSKAAVSGFEIKCLVPVFSDPYTEPGHKAQVLGVCASCL